MLTQAQLPFSSSVDVEDKPTCRYLVLSISAGCDPANRLYLADLGKTPRNATSGALELQKDNGSMGVTQLPLIKLVDNFDGQFSYVANEGARFTCITNLGAPNYRHASMMGLLHTADCLTVHLKRLSASQQGNDSSWVKVLCLDCHGPP